MARPILLWGATGQARVLAEFLPDLGYEIVALCDNNPSLRSPWSNIPLLDGLDGLRTWKIEHGRADYEFLVAIGGGHGGDRIAVFDSLVELGLKPASAIHPRANVAKTAKVAAGCQVLMGAAVGADAQLGRTVIINTNASVDHESVVADGAHIGPGATVCGCVRVGRGAFVGAGAVLLPRIDVGECAIIGAGAVVTKDVAPHAVMVGNPARVQRHLE